jgi:hypothetical protein
MFNTYIGVLKDAFVYPFKHFIDISGVFIMTLVVYVAIVYAGILFAKYGLGVAELTGLVYIISAILALAILLALMPLYVSVTRHIVLGEKVESVVFGKMLKTREVTTFIAWIKLLLLMIAPIFLAGVLISLIGTDEGPMLSIGWKLAATKEHIIMWVAILIALYLGVRGSMMVVHGALDNDISIKASFAVTKMHVLFIFIVVLSLIILLSLLSCALMYVYGIVGGLWGIGDLFRLDIFGLLVATIVIVLFRMLLGVIFVAGLSKVYMTIGK